MKWARGRVFGFPLDHVGPRVATLILLLLFSGICQARWSPQEADALESPEYLVKADFIYNIARFVEWRQGHTPSRELHLGIFGEDPFGENIRAIEGQTVNGRTIIVHRMTILDETAKKCHILFLSSSEKEKMENILRSLQDSAVLTIGDTPGFARMGGIINMIKVEGSIRFEVNVDAATRAGLFISSEVLKLAIIVKNK